MNVTIPESHSLSFEKENTQNDTRYNEPTIHSTTSTTSSFNYASLNGIAIFKVHAVQIERLYKSYGESSILNGITLTVPTSNIYGLLGPSGCGKSTLLKLICGRLSYQDGKIRIYGKAPNTRNHNCPGNLIGYMPQEIALFNDFNSEQTLIYYGSLYNMHINDIYERISFLKEFLNLPDLTRKVAVLSGGQQRRLSLAVALIHKPKLLLLDEPTVGVDPVLRARIWEYLLTLSESGTSVIITTHYIEEATMAHRVGMMRDGVLLAEGRPEQLMRKFHADTLEKVFLSLCESESSTRVVKNSIALESPFQTPKRGADVNGSKDSISGSPVSYISSNSLLYNHSEDSGSPDIPYCGGLPFFQIIKVLLWKNWVLSSQNIAFIISQFLLPAIQVLLFCLAIGGNPKDLNMGLINNDLNISINNHSVSFSQAFISSIDTSIITLNNYNSLADAEFAVMNGDAWGILNFPSDYSEALYGSCDDGGSTYNISDLMLYMDFTNQQIAATLLSSLEKTSMVSGINTLSAIEFLGKNCSYSRFSPAVKPGPPVYGTIDASFTSFIAPGMIISISFAQSIGLTALALVMAKKEGTQDRQWAAGVKPSEIMVAHVIFQVILLIIQLGFLFIVALVIFKIPCLGSLLLLYALTMILGMCGMLYGLFLSSICDDENQAINYSNGSFFPILLLSGILWPIQGIPLYLRYISYALPTTWAASAMRDILAKGWGLEHYEVWMGFVVVIAWTLAFLAVSSRGVKHVD